MGITIHYKGKLNDPAEIDAVVDFVQQRAVAQGWSWTHINDNWEDEVDAQLIHTSKSDLDLTGNAGLKGFSLDIDPQCESVPLLFDSFGYLNVCSAKARKTAKTRIKQGLRNLCG